MNQMKLEELQISELESLNKILESNQQKSDFSSQYKYRKKFTMTIVFILSIILLLIINFSLDVYQLYKSISNENIYIADFYLFIYFLAISGIVGYILFSIKSYLTLKDAFHIQEQTLNVENYEQEKSISLVILKHYKSHKNIDIQTKAATLYQQVKTNSLHSPFSSIKIDILDNLDKKAIASVYTSAKEVSLFTAFFPTPAFDSIVIIISSVKMMKNIFQIYGYRTNLFTSLLITRKILENASIAALVEYADDSMNDLFGNTLISKFSTKMAQGIGNGVLILRIGNIVIQSARPFAPTGSIASYKQMVQLFVKYIKEKVGRK